MCHFTVLARSSRRMDSSNLIQCLFRRCTDIPRWLWVFRPLPTPNFKKLSGLLRFNSRPRQSSPELLRRCLGKKACVVPSASLLRVTVLCPCGWRRSSYYEMYSCYRLRNINGASNVRSKRQSKCFPCTNTNKYWSTVRTSSLGASSTTEHQRRSEPRVR